MYVLPMIQGKLSGTPGGQTVYDRATNVTWLADANVAASNAFGLPRCTAPGQPKICVASDGAVTWIQRASSLPN